VPSEQPSKQDNREELDFQFDEELPNKQINLPKVFPQNRRRTTSLTLDLYEEKYVHLFIDQLFFN